MAPPPSYQPVGPIAMARGLLRRWWGAELVLAERSGSPPGPATPPANEVCRRALASPEGARRCGASITCAQEKAAARPEQVAAHECHLGFTLLAAAGPEGEPIVACGLRFRATDADELVRLGDRLREFRAVDPQSAVDESFAVEPCHERSRVEDLVLGAAAEALRSEPARAGPRPGRPRGTQPQAIVGQSLPMLEVQRLVERVAFSDSTVLVQGESGTGKELVARRIHDLSPRRDRPFVAQNCSALNDNLLESALFGHVRGAFTGAARDTPGLFELADGGTLFLDEIGDTSPALQVKLLRVLQEGTFTPVGGTEARRADVRVLAATHKDLGELVRLRLFREDLYYRIHVIRLVVPPLRERLDDLPLLVREFLRRFSRLDPPPRLAPQVNDVFTRYPWPGNVRELQNELERLCVLAGDEPEITLAHVSPRIAQAASSPAPRPSPRPADGSAPPHLHVAVEALERQLIAESLTRHDGNRTRVAQELGIARSNLLLKLDRYGLAKRAPKRRRPRT